MTLDTAGPKTVGASNLGPSTQSARRLPVPALDSASSDRVRCFHPPKLPTSRFRRTSIPSAPKGFDTTLHRAFEVSSPEGLSTPSFLRQDFWSLQPGGPFTPQIRRPARIQTQDLRPLEPPLGDWEPQVRKDQNDTIASKSHEPCSFHSCWFRRTHQSRSSILGSTSHAAGEPTTISASPRTEQRKPPVSAKLQNLHPEGCQPQNLTESFGPRPNSSLSPPQTLGSLEKSFLPQARFRLASELDASI